MNTDVEPIHEEARKHMVIQNPRSRTISVRLSEEEYVGLKKLCRITGARSVSDLTRGAMNAVLNGASRDNVLDFRMEEFRNMLRNLDQKLDQLAAGMAGVESDR